VRVHNLGSEHKTEIKGQHQAKQDAGREDGEFHDRMVHTCHHNTMHVTILSMKIAFVSIPDRDA
jgi:hypothetical protein